MESLFMDPTYPLVPIANFISFFLVFITLLTVGQPSNIGVCMYAIWTCLACLATAVNTVVWRDNVDNVAPIWCDITSHILVGSSTGIPVCSFVNTRHISQITRLRGPDERRERIRNLVFDIFLCIGLPILTMGDYYVVQNHRFSIFEEYGCSLSELDSGVELLLLQSWTVGLPLLSILLYLPKILWYFYHQRKTINGSLVEDGCLSRSTYLRILALGCLDILFTFPIAILGLVVNIKESHIVFYQGWTTVHSDWEPAQIQKRDWMVTPFAAFNVRWNEWVTVLSAFIFFTLFGLSADAWAKQQRFLRLILHPTTWKQSKTEPEFSSIIFQSHNSDIRVLPTSRG